MKIYEYIADGDRHNYFITDQEHHEVKTSVGRGVSLINSWKPIPVRNFFGEKEGLFLNKISDFPSLRDPVLSEKAWKVFEPYIKHYVEPLPLITPEGKYFALNILNIIDALDKEKSEVSYNRVTNRVSRILKHVFHTDKIEGQLIFKVPETLGLGVYVSEEFKKIVEDNNLKGLDFSTVVFEAKR